jgi:CheY-like chemotaxis protein
MKKIVLIDDDNGILETTVDILELAGYKVFTANNGKEGINQIKTKKPDVILCDINMPKLDGYEVFRILNRMPETASIPFIFLSANKQNYEIRRGMNLGADDYLTKPFKEIDLLDSIETRIERKNKLKNNFDESINGFNDFIQVANEIIPLDNLVNHKLRRHYLKDEVIFNEEDYITFIYYIVKGKVKRISTDSHGKEFLDDIHHTNEFFGYLNFFKDNQGKHKRTAIALEPTEVALIPKKEFKKLIMQNRDVSSAFIKILSGNVFSKEERLLQIAYASVRERVANAILCLLKEQKHTLSDNVLDISRFDLANVVGTSKESLIRTLSEFKKESVIKTGRTYIKVLDSKALEKSSKGF